MKARNPVLLFGCAAISAISVCTLFSPNVEAQSTTYYINASCATPGNGTTSTCDNDADDAWDDLSDITGLSAGDSVLLKRGEIWREQLTIPTTGTSGNPITFGAYGSGADPIISGADIVSTWGSVSSEDFTDGPGETPEAYWYFEEASGTRYDETANNNDLSESGTIDQNTTQYVQGSASCDTNAVGNKLTIAHASISSNIPFKKNPTTVFTVGIRVYFHDTPVAWGPVWAYINGTTGFSFLVDTDPTFMFKFFDSENNARDRDSAVSVSTGVWYSLVLRRDSGGDVQGFVDGVQKTTVNDDIGVVTGGAMDFGNNQDVSVDEAFMFDEALTDDQIMAIHLYGLDGSRMPSNVWSASLATEANQVFFDEAIGTKEQLACPGDLSVDQEWCWDSNALYQLSTSDPDTRYTSPGTEASQRDNVVNFNSKDYIVIENLSVRSANASNILVSGQNNIVRYTFIQYGLDGLADSGGTNEFYYCIFDCQEDDGVLVTAAGSTFYNLVIHCASGDGIELQANAEIKNVIFESVAWDDINENGGSATASNNFADSDGDPLFADISSDDFRILWGSGAIDAGVDVGLTRDYEGKVIPQGSAPDIGAYEAMIPSARRRE